MGLRFVVYEFVKFAWCWVGVSLDLEWGMDVDVLEERASVGLLVQQILNLNLNLKLVLSEVDPTVTWRKAGWI